MKPLEILSALPKWSAAKPGQILDSPAFAFPCRLGEETETFSLGAVQGGDTLNLSILFGDEPHVLRLSRTPRFPELDKVWDSRAEMPEPILLALVEKECGAFFQMLENTVRRQMRLVGISSETSPDEQALLAQVADISFALTRSATMVAALGIIRHLDVAHEAIRAESLPFETEHAAFALSAADLASMAVGDALLLPEVGAVSPRLVVDGRFAVDEAGVAPFSDDGRCRVISAEQSVMTLGELFDAAEDPESRKSKVESLALGSESSAQLRLVHNGRTVANGHLDRIGGQSALVVEEKSA